MQFDEVSFYVWSVPESPWFAFVRKAFCIIAPQAERRFLSLTQRFHTEKCGLSISRFAGVYLFKRPKSTFCLCDDLRIDIQILKMFIIPSRLHFLRKTGRQGSVRPPIQVFNISLIVRGWFETPVSRLTGSGFPVAHENWDIKTLSLTSQTALLKHVVSSEILCQTAFARFTFPRSVPRQLGL